MFYRRLTSVAEKISHICHTIQKKFTSNMARAGKEIPFIAHKLCTKYDGESDELQYVSYYPDRRAHEKEMRRRWREEEVADTETVECCEEAEEECCEEEY